jgi:dethiobiotin synthetase
MQGFLVTGSDTGVGKTFVLAGVARTLRRQGHPFRVCKPVATGAEASGGCLVSDDTRVLAEAAGESDLEQVTPWTFSVPAAPPVAARWAGTTLVLEEIAAAVRARSSAEGPLLVEGVGGLLCPLTERETIADLALALALPLLIVVRRSLGTLNHTLLTLEAARSRGLAILGIVVNETTPVQGIAEETNVEELRRRIDVPVLAVVPFQSERHSREIAELAAIDWRALAGTGKILPGTS